MAQSAACRFDNHDDCVINTCTCLCHDEMYDYDPEEDW